jgi:hypothetical protein
MQEKEENSCTNVFKNSDIEARKKALANILAEIINTQLKIGKNL